MLENTTKTDLKDILILIFNISKEIKKIKIVNQEFQVAEDSLLKKYLISLEEKANPDLIEKIFKEFKLSSEDKYFINLLYKAAEEAKEVDDYYKLFLLNPPKTLNKFISLKDLNTQVQDAQKIYDESKKEVEIAESKFETFKKEYEENLISRGEELKKTASDLKTQKEELIYESRGLKFESILTQDKHNEKEKTYQENKKRYNEKQVTHQKSIREYIEKQEEFLESIIKANEGFIKAKENLSDLEANERFIKVQENLSDLEAQENLLNQLNERIQKDKERYEKEQKEYQKAQKVFKESIKSLKSLVSLRIEAIYKMVIEFKIDQQNNERKTNRSLIDFIFIPINGLKRWFEKKIGTLRDPSEDTKVLKNQLEYLKFRRKVAVLTRNQNISSSGDQYNCSNGKNMGTNKVGGPGSH